MVSRPSGSGGVDAARRELRCLQADARERSSRLCPVLPPPCWDRAIPPPLCWGCPVVSCNTSTCVSYCVRRADIQPFPEPRYSGQCLPVFVEFPPSLSSVSPERFTNIMRGRKQLQILKIAGRCTKLALILLSVQLKLVWKQCEMKPWWKMIFRIPNCK